MGVTNTLRAHARLYGKVALFWLIVGGMLAVASLQTLAHVGRQLRALATRDRRDGEGTQPAD